MAESQNAKDLRDATIAYLEKKYFLISRRGFIATLVGTVIVVGGVSFGSARSVIKDAATIQHLNDIEAGAKVARILSEGNHLLPEGTVLAVTGGNHIDDIPNICPEGWDPFTQANGRVMVGAGAQTESTSVRTPMDIGGSETTPHLVPAAHEHRLFAAGNAGATRSPKYGEAIAVEASKDEGGLHNENFEYQIRPGSNPATLGATDNVGSSDSLPIMQPFIAVTFCLKL